VSPAEDVQERPERPRLPPRPARQPPAPALSVRRGWQPPAGPPPPQWGPPAGEPPREGGSIGRRFLLGALAVVVLSGAGTAAFALGEVNNIIAALHLSRHVKVSRRLVPVAAKGRPETLLLVGNDERPLSKYKHYGHEVLPHSNEMLLVRIDPSKPTISMMSIPRELRVTFTTPRGELVTNRINSAYTFGYEQGGSTSAGVNLMVETIERTLPGIGKINQVFVTNFKRFERAVNEIGCVYMTVDKRYWHTNEPFGEQYFEIHLPAGYQRLCGQHALEFVANRHESTSLIRDARDQRFLLEVKAQYGPTLFENRERFERVFGHTVENTLGSEEEVLNLLNLLIGSASKPVRQVHFNVTLGPSEDTATPAQISEAVHSFMSGTAPISSARLRHAVHGARSAHAPGSSHAPPPGSSLSRTPASTLQAARAMAGEVPFPVEVPQYQYATAETSEDELHHYKIIGAHGHWHPAYVIVVGPVGLGQYYDVEGTTWTSAPLFSAPSSSVEVGGRTYQLFYDGERIKTVAWREGDAVYWIENTLTYALSPQQMVAIARETRPVAGRGAGPASGSGAASIIPRNVALPQRPVASVNTRTKIGDYLGFVVFALALLLAALLLVRRRELASLRDEVEQALALEAQGRAGSGR
jgi:LCP family protein required for cell wall assembly